MLKQWFVNIFYKKGNLLEDILIELKNIHYHLDNLETFYMMVNKIEIKEKEIVEDKK